MKAGKRRGAPRRYVLRETGEYDLNHRISKGPPRQGPYRFNLYREAFPFFHVKHFQSRTFISRRP